MFDLKLISIGKRRPKSDTYVLVCLSNKLFMTSYYFEDSKGKWFSSSDNIWDKYYTDYVTSWTELPKLPKR